jgi:hypothetical protein
METVMNLIHAIRRPAGIALWLATVVLTSLTAAAPAALATPWPRPPGWNKHPPVPASTRPVLRFPPGWNKHPPLPAHLHPLATAGIPGWQLTLMAITVILLAATSIAIGYPGPGRTAAGERTQRLSHDHVRRHADPQGQRQGERPHPGSRPSRDGVAGRFTQDIATATSVATGQNRPAPPATMPRRMMIGPRPRPRTVQLCIHCRQNPAGFWVSRTSDQIARRPWCLSCCQWLDPSRYQVIPFDGHGGAGRFQ